MLITKEVEMPITRRNVTYYKNKGYKCKIGDITIVNVNDLPHGSRCKVEYYCDYCLENGVKTTILQGYNTYVRNHNSGIGNKDCCKKCSPIKQKESYIAKHGVSHPMKKAENKQKVADKGRTKFIEVETLFKKREYVLLSDKKDFKTVGDKLKYICNKHKDCGIQEIDYFHLKRGQGCKYCGLERISGKNSYLWKGGISPLHNYLRKKINDWKRDSMINSNYKCILTGNNFNIIHHLYSFSNILEEVMSELGYGIYESINMYSESELKNIENKLVQKHYEYPLGVCLVESLHKLYHQLYGEGNNTPEQFEEFKTRLRLGEFNDFLEENNLELAI